MAGHAFIFRAGAGSPRQGGGRRAAGATLGPLPGNSRGWWLALLAGGCLLLLVPALGLAMRVSVRDGQTVRLKLRNILTTDNVQKNDPIEFEVTEDVIINGQVAIKTGAIATGRILDIKGAYKRGAKGAEVVFKFDTVRAADGQELPLRVLAGKTKKGKGDEIHERSVIPGQIQRVVGADKGKEYEAYVNGSFTVMAAALAASPTPSALPGQAGTSAAEQPRTPAPTVSPPLTVAAPLPAMPAVDESAEPSTVDFSSTPDGADIVIDGNVVGSTPSNLRLSPGHHAIELHMAGYRTWSRDMVVDPASHPSVRATLVRQ